MKSIWRRLNLYWQLFKLEVEIADAERVMSWYCDMGIDVSIIYAQILVLHAQRDQFLRRLCR
ncbi:hypothetical protein [Janthinobacterium sp. B9-8]|uniref:hypothetical protein n=1 Tax=Janthinobacterium sp. B9-8 TaxID=1236179 RepID=UPI00061D2C98|nr:hypothetical protein [Janthinobacterium sp. B9-8]AMC34757.1 hypothetical protein VN23_09115 [Janthinobacterium sp. B9-8]